MTQFADVLAAVRPQERTVRLVLDGAAVAERADLVAQIAAANAAADSIAGPPELPELAAQLADVDERLAAAAVAFRMRALSRNAYRNLVAAHPADETAWDLQAFPPALVAACSADPVMTVPEVEQLLDVIGEGQFDRLFAAAYGACTEVDGVPFSVAASPTRG